MQRHGLWAASVPQVGMMDCTTAQLAWVMSEYTTTETCVVLVLPLLLPWGPLVAHRQDSGL